MPERPSKRLIEVSLTRNAEVLKRKWRISEQTTEVRLEGTVLGAFTVAHHWRLPAFPKLMMGCLNLATPAWRCGADFVRTSQWISAIPADGDSWRNDAPVSVMLGIERYTASDLENSAGYPSNAVALERAQNEAGRVQGEVFDLLQAMLSGKVVQPPHNMGYSLAI